MPFPLLCCKSGTDDKLRARCRSIVDWLAAVTCIPGIDLSKLKPVVVADVELPPGKTSVAELLLDENVRVRGFWELCCWLWTWCWWWGPELVAPFAPLAVLVLAPMIKLNLNDFLIRKKINSFNWRICLYQKSISRSNTKIDCLFSIALNKLCGFVHIQSFLHSKR